MASALDDLDYLSSDFDLNSLTVPRLRAILVSHDIPYPSSAKKAQLIKILEDEVLPKARKLLRDRERVRRTSAGITDMSNRSNDALNIEDDGYGRDSLPPPPATPSSVSTATGTRRGRSRQSTRASTVDTEDSAVVAATPKRRVRSSKSARASDAEHTDDNRYTPSVASTTSRRSTARKPRHTEAIPSLETIDQSPTIKTESRASSIFTDDNPFQSGSSPATEQTPKLRTAGGERSRKSTPRVSVEGAEQRRSRVSGIHDDIKREYHSTPRKSSFEFSTSRLRTPTPKAEEESENDSDEEEGEEVPGEEFTPDEQLALETAGAPSDRVLTRRSKKSRSYRLPSAVMFLLLAGFAAWWRQEKIEIGFCGVGKSRWSLADTNVPEWASVLEPKCEPCPSHAFCYQNFVVECENDFILRHHPLSLNGLIPIPPTCEPDSEKSSRILSVANKAVEELRQRRAQYECGDGDKASSPSIAEPELKQAVANQRRVKMSDEEFDELWAAAIGEIMAREEISVSEGPSFNSYSSSSVARLPIGCAFRRHLRLSLVAYRLPLSAIAIVVAGLAYLRAQFITRRKDLARVPELVGTTLDRLSTQAALYSRGEAPEPWISIGQLRDDVLRSELRGHRRERLWKRVRAVVEGNANVRAAVREGRGGDVTRVWEWIGSIGNHLDGVRRDSGRVRFSLSPSNEASAGVPQDSSIVRSPRESRKWDEGRPIY